MNMPEPKSAAAAADQPGGRHSRFGRWLYDALWVLCRTLGVSVLGVRTHFAEPLPKQGGLIVLSSHQSHFDPLLLGLASNRRLSSLARASLYKFKPFAFLITALDAVPIDSKASTIVAMKALIRRLEGGAAVVIFPEGTRTATGQLGELKSGFTLLAKRARVPIVPVAIVGAWECWPKSRMFPRPGRVRVEFGKILRPEEIAAMDERQILAECTTRLTQLDARARAIRNHVQK